MKSFVYSKRLAQIAAQLMETSGVRLYHDQALFKEPGGGFTPWHADQYYWPLATNKTITAWIPMQETPLEMGPLEFSAKSFRLHGGRELKISDNSEQVISRKLRLNDFEHIVKIYDGMLLNRKQNQIRYKLWMNSRKHEQRLNLETQKSFRVRRADKKGNVQSIVKFKRRYQLSLQY